MPEDTVCSFCEDNEATYRVVLQSLEGENIRVCFICDDCLVDIDL
jgi:hypothetical protein